MNRIWLSAALCGLYAVGLFGQEDERFDRLRMEDLIGVPALKPMQAPGLLGLFPFAYLPDAVSCSVSAGMEV